MFKIHICSKNPGMRKEVTSFRYPAKNREECFTCF